MITFLRHRTGAAQFDRALHNHVGDAKPELRELIGKHFPDAPILPELGGEPAAELPDQTDSSAEFVGSLI